MNPIEAGVDPRMRERWVAARRYEGRRRLRLIMAIVITFAVVGIAYLIASSSLLGAGTVQVRGVTRVTPAAVRTAAHIAEGEPLLFLDTELIVRRVERLPYVQHARVATELPETVVITVTERHGVGWTRDASPTPISIVDGTGRVLERATTAPDGLPEVVGSGDPAAIGTRVQHPEIFRVLAALPDALRLVTLRSTVKGGEATLTLRGDPPEAAEVQLGTMTRVRAKAATALAVLDALRTRSERVQILDVRVPTAPATR